MTGPVTGGTNAGQGGTGTGVSGATGPTGINAGQPGAGGVGGVTGPGATITTYHVAVGTVVHFPDGSQVKLVGAQEVYAPAGTVIEGGIGGTGSRTLPDPGLVVAEGTPGEVDTTPTGQPPPLPVPAGQPAARPWDETQQAADVIKAYDYARKLFTSTLPGITHQIDLLAHRSIAG